MDQQVVDALASAEIDTSFEKYFPAIGIEVDEDGRPRPAGERIIVIQGEKTATVALRPISALLSGSRQPPSFKAGPTPEYSFFFLMIEAALNNYCVSTERLEYDDELARLYNLLRRRPDGTDPNPLFSYLQASVCLYLSLREGSPAELDAVLNRLTRSAKGFREGAASTGYVSFLIEQFQQG